MCSTQPSYFRWLTVLLTALSWLVVSNHCALAAALVSNTKTSCDHCHADEKSAPSKSSDSGHEVACCKMLKAVGAEYKTVQPVAGLLGTMDYAVFSGGWITPPASECPSVMPTGPPGVVSFAEYDLQRCHLVNAPPVVG